MLITNIVKNTLRFCILILITIEDVFRDTTYFSWLVYFNVFMIKFVCLFQTAYNQRDPAHSFLRQRMALLFLPAEHITDTFLRLETRNSNQAVQHVLDYIYRTWIRNLFSSGRFTRHLSVQTMAWRGGMTGSTTSLQLGERCRFIA